MHTAEKSTFHLNFFVPALCRIVLNISLSENAIKVHSKLVLFIYAPNASVHNYLILFVYPQIVNNQMHELKHLDTHTKC